jgi:hypothetical protein
VKSQEKLYQRLHELFNYKSGNFYWKVKRPNSQIGSKAGYVKDNGYVAVTFDNKKYYAHRLVWLYHHKYMPTIIDHVDGDILNNKIKNLRIATFSQNQHNRVIAKNNKTGIKGLGITKSKSKKGTIYSYYRISISNDYKRIRKCFPLTAKKEAIQFLNKIRKEAHGTYAKFN